MAFQWIDFIHLADSLANDNSSPTLDAGRRTAISRSYFGAYCKARDFAVKDSRGAFKPEKKADDHRNVRLYFLNHKDENLKCVANTLQSLRDWRNNSDYDESWDCFPFVNKSIEDAGNIFSILA